VRTEKTMSRIRATINSIRARLHYDEVAGEVETELGFHIGMRTQANIEAGMTPAEARLAAKQSFGDFDRIKVSCCEIKRGFPFDLRPLKIGLYIAIACLAGGVSLWAVNMPHHNVFGVLWQLAAIAVLMCSFLVGRRKH
jgi:hypothetical protein